MKLYFCYLLEYDEIIPLFIADNLDKAKGLIKKHVNSEGDLEWEEGFESDLEARNNFDSCHILEVSLNTLIEFHRREQ